MIHLSLLHMALSYFQGSDWWINFPIGWVWADQADSIKHVGVCPVVLAILSICLTSHHMNVASPWSVNCHTERQNEFGDCYLNGAPSPKFLINPR